MKLGFKSNSVLSFLIISSVVAIQFFMPFHANLCASVNIFWLSLCSDIFVFLSQSLIHDICVIVDIVSQPISPNVAEIRAFIFTLRKLLIRLF